MRRDATIDRRFVRCPKASTLAYGKWRAQVHDWIVWRYPESDGTPGDGPHIGRMIGRIAYAPSLGETGQIKDWILVLALSSDHTHAYERWIDPAWVSQVNGPHEDIAAFLTWFASPTLPDVHWLRHAGEYGTLSANQATDEPWRTQWSFAGKLTHFAEYWERARVALGYGTDRERAAFLRERA